MLFLTGRSCQDAAHGDAADAELASDLGFADAGAMKLLDSVSFEAGGERAAQSFASLPGVSQTSTNALAQRFTFELSEDGEHRGWPMCSSP